MPRFLCFTIRFLDTRFHGRSDQGQPEWPPSPLRLFQALVAAAAARAGERTNLQSPIAALRWLERQDAPAVVAPAAMPARHSYRLYVPDNVGDLVAASWIRGRAADIADYRAEKDVRPHHLQSEAVHYLYPVDSDPPDFLPQIETLRAAARSITHLGWGIDMVVGDAALLSDSDAAALVGERWLPAHQGTGQRLRVPKPGTLDNLLRKHRAFLGRLAGQSPRKASFQPVPPLSQFRLVAYRRATAPPPCPFAAFKLLQPNASAYRPFSPTRQAAVVAGMVRHALAQIAQHQRPFGWDDAQIARIVLGHDRNGKAIRPDPLEPRFGYLPLPTIALYGQSHISRHVTSIRRVLVVGTPGMDEPVRWVRQALAGSQLIREENHAVAAVLSRVPSADWVVQQYVRSAATWTTVTPVILPGYDDRNSAKAERLLRKALLHAGFARELVDRAELNWRKVGYLPGIDLASRYRRPANTCEAPVCHIKITWRDASGQPLKIPGPLAIGSGRFRGLGLFASVEP